MENIVPSASQTVNAKSGGFFDGTQAHETLPFEGDCKSLVWYVSSAAPRARGRLLRELVWMGFMLPRKQRRIHGTLWSSKLYSPISKATQDGVLRG